MIYETYLTQCPICKTELGVSVPEGADSAIHKCWSCAANFTFTRPDEPAVTPMPYVFEQQKAEPGLRFDAGKNRYDLIPPDALDELAKVYTVGAAKYADRNWERGMSWGRCFGSLMRHSWKFWRGQTVDEETGCHHMALAAWNCLALLTFDFRKVGTDDRKVS